jgi:hypothetical protein
MSVDLEAAFDRAMMDIYVRAKSEANYTASIFHRMLCERGGLATARQLINERTPSEGYTALWERGRLDLTVEAVVTDNRVWHDLLSLRNWSEHESVSATTVTNLRDDYALPQNEQTSL